MKVRDLGITLISVAAGVLCGGVEEYPHLESGVGQRCEPAPEDRGGSGRGPGETDHDSHSGRLAGAVRAEETGHPPGAVGARVRAWGCPTLGALLKVSCPGCPGEG
jgi:hypothetical protein